MRKTITVTEAARNFADCINRTRYQNVTFILLKNGFPVAQLVPASEKVCTGQDLAEVLSQTELSPEEAAAWHDDIQSSRKALKPPGDKWQ